MMLHQLKIGSFTFSYNVTVDELGVEIDLLSVMFGDNELSDDEMDAINDEHVYDLAIKEAIKLNNKNLNRAA